MCLSDRESSKQESAPADFHKLALSSRLQFKEAAQRQNVTSVRSRFSFYDASSLLKLAHYTSAIGRLAEAPAALLSNVPLILSCRRRRRRPLLGTGRTFAALILTQAGGKNLTTEDRG